MAHNVADVVSPDNHPNGSTNASTAYSTMMKTVTTFDRPTSVKDTWATYEMVLNLIKPLNTQLTMGAPQTPEQALSLMLLLYNLLQVHPIVGPTYLNAVSNALQPITKWPNPHGDVALVLMTALELELKAPGCAMWKRALSTLPY